MSPHPAPLASEHRRIGDVDRHRTSTMLGLALTAGYLDVAEYDTRLERVFDARTHGDLAVLTCDLPTSTLARSDPHRQAARRRRALVGVGVHAAAVAVAVALTACWVIWLAIGSTAGVWYPWPIWPTIGGLLGVLSHWVPTVLVIRRGATRPS